MNTSRENWLKKREENDISLFEKIKNNSSPDISDLWALSEERFIEWRKLHDFPILLGHFDKVLTDFRDWKYENGLTNEIVIESGEITPFLEKKRSSKKDKALYLTKYEFEGKDKTFVSYQMLEGKKEYFGRIYNFSLLQKFTPYLDWLAKKGKTEEILKINSRHGPKSDYERVFIHADIYAQKTGFELLKMGGVSVPVDGLGILHRGKRMEFVNLSGLKFQGETLFGEEGNLSCSYCACDNWIAEKLDMSLLRLSHCSVENFTLINSKLQQWEFYDCNVTGDFFVSKLYHVKITGGRFEPVMMDCKLSDTDVSEDSNIPNDNFFAYKTFKKIYQNQGDDDKAREYFVLENEFIRSKLRRLSLKYVTKSISYFYWQYGNKPHRIIYFSVLIILICGLIFWKNSDLIALNSSIICFNFWDGLYFSTITFTTVGYGDLIPIGWLKILTSIEAFLGVINMGFLIGGYSNTKY